MATNAALEIAKAIIKAIGLPVIIIIGAIGLISVLIKKQ